MPESTCRWNAFLRGLDLAIERIGLEAGPLSQWLHAGLTSAGLHASKIRPCDGAAHELTHAQSKAIKDLPDLFPPNLPQIYSRFMSKISDPSLSLRCSPRKFCAK
jgi:hypothetical protein